jgi:hypothetical protein
MDKGRGLGIILVWEAEALKLLWSRARFWQERELRGRSGTSCVNLL